MSWTGIGSLAPGAQVTATFDVTITTVTGASQTYVNQGTATSTQTGNVLTDSNGNPSDGNQPTTFTAVGSGGTPQAALDVQKRWAIAVDTPPIGVASPGDTLRLHDHRGQQRQRAVGQHARHRSRPDLHRRAQSVHVAMWPARW